MSNLENWFQSPRYGAGLGLLFIWALIWKGLALWRSAKEDNKWWFIALLVLQTWGIVEILYLFFFAKEKLAISTKPKTKSKK